MAISLLKGGDMLQHAHFAQMSLACCFISKVNI